MGFQSLSVKTGVSAWQAEGMRAKAGAIASGRVETEQQYFGRGSEMWRGRWDMAEREMLRDMADGDGSGGSYGLFVTRDGATGYRNGKYACVAVAMVVRCACLRLGGKQDCPEKRM